MDVSLSTVKYTVFQIPVGRSHCSWAPDLGKPKSGAAEGIRCDHSQDSGHGTPERLTPGKGLGRLLVCVLGRDALHGEEGGSMLLTSGKCTFSYVSSPVFFPPVLVSVPWVTVTIWKRSEFMCWQLGPQCDEAGIWGNL